MCVVEVAREELDRGRAVSLLVRFAVRQVMHVHLRRGGVSNKNDYV